MVDPGGRGVRDQAVFAVRGEKQMTLVIINRGESFPLDAAFSEKYALRSGALLTAPSLDDHNTAESQSLRMVSLSAEALRGPGGTVEVPARTVLLLSFGVR